MDWDQVIHFKKSEWEPGADQVVPKLIFLLDAIRQAYGKPIHIHCAFAQKGHSSKSWHYKGGAVDFHFDDHDHLAQFHCIQAFEDVGGVGYYNPNIWNHSGWHIDIRPTRLYWTQRGDTYIYSLQSVLEDVKKYSK